MMQHHDAQQLSWQDIQRIVGVQLSVELLRFDHIGLHLLPRTASILATSEPVTIGVGDNTSNNTLPLSPLTPPSPPSPPSPIDLDSDIELIEDESDDEEYIVDNDGDGDGDGDGVPPTPSPDKPHSEEDNTTDLGQYLEVTLSTEIEPDEEKKAEESELVMPAPLAEEKPLKHACRVCPERFSSYYELKKHANGHERDEAETKIEKEAKHGCHVCSEKFSSYYELRKHINLHFPGMLEGGTGVGGKASYCHICKKDYTKTGFMNHLRKHTGERPFVCELCQKAFSQSSSLSIHMKFHLNVRKHACTVCEKKFVTKSELSRHMTVHTKQKSYYCGVCDKAFTRSDNMKKHEKTHSQNRQTGEMKPKMPVPEIL